jgi:hypothetical protein
MKHYIGNQQVEPGVYVNIRRFSFESLQSKGRLPGTERDQYHKVSPLTLLVAGPVLGGLYVVFLPFVGMAMLTWFAGGKALQLMAHAAAVSGRVLRPAWRPGPAFLSRSKRSDGTAKREDGWAAEVKRQLEKGGDDEDGDGSRTA